MAAPSPPIACTPSCTSTPAPSRSPPSAGRTASSAAPWGPSWQCHATAVVWVRHAFAHLHTWKEVSSRRADGIEEQTGNVSQSWYFFPASYIHKPARQFLPSPSAGLFLPAWQLNGGFSQTWRCFLCELIHHTGPVAVSLILRLRREDDVGMIQSGSTLQAGGWGTARRVTRWFRVQYETEEQSVARITVYQPPGFLNV